LHSSQHIQYINTAQESANTYNIIATGCTQGRVQQTSIQSWIMCVSHLVTIQLQWSSLGQWAGRSGHLLHTFDSQLTGLCFNVYALQCWQIRLTRCDSKSVH